MVDGHWLAPEHKHFPPASKAAVRTLRWGSVAGQPQRTTRASTKSVPVEAQVNPLALLPPGMMLGVIGAAAYPLLPWVPPE